ncbi:MAG: response regulator transcription factor [Elusimicrobia bacterium]|nr:response regulator transcription factor [Elusimicrobiota bacterium]
MTTLSGGGMQTKVLVVDDEEDYRIIIKDVLETAGCRVTVAGDGEAGLKALAGDDFEVVLVDWMMPRMDGQTFVQNLRRDPAKKDLPVIMLTVKQTADDELEALHFGVDDFIVKPFQADDLLARLRAVLRRAKA